MLQPAGRGEPAPTASGCAEAVLLVPGFFSPAWMMRPLRRRLLDRSIRAEIWDDAVFSQPAAANAERFAAQLSARQHPARVVAHSYGALLVTLALSPCEPLGVKQLILTAPVVAPVRGARWVPRFAQRVVPAFDALTRPREVADALRRLSRALPILLVWSRYDLFVDSRVLAGCDSIRQVHVRGTHNSVLFQPSVLRRVVRELEQPV